ncbi:hypothetical protein KL867_17210 [Ruegeria litorea]|uniref:Uncharacterized protein n=1 Tax=Falsiruegeria litorea TaxID=1280831 RepID=A0ABS5WUK1_9RHOB|nr:hypothetical protein [Falsiruegeria litorea]
MGIGIAFQFPAAFDAAALAQVLRGRALTKCLIRQAAANGREFLKPFVVAQDARLFRCRGRKAMQLADAFDVMEAKAARHGKAAPFTPSQVSMGRHYRDLVERYLSAGVRCSSLESVAQSGGSSGGEFIDAVLRDREEIEMLRRRIGSGAAIVVRRHRPSQRGSRSTIFDQRLVDMVCIEELTMTEILKAHKWSVDRKYVRDLKKALADALDRMG